MDFKIDPDWETTILFSEKPYEHKPTDSEYNKMKFERVTVTIPELASRIQEGYSFCSTSRKKKEVSYSNMISVDIDGSTEPMRDFVTKLKYVPSLYYTTPSNLKYETDKKYRFRLLYFLEKPTNGVSSYNNTFEYIVEENHLRELLPDFSVDKLQANQMFNGSFNCDMVSTNMVYSVPSVFLENIDQEECIECLDSDLSEEVCLLFHKSKRIRDFLKTYMDKFGFPGFVEETPYVPTDIEGVLVPAGPYIKVPKKYAWFDSVKKQKVYSKWKDGENRHGKLFLAGLILRVLNPYLSIEELFFDFVFYIYKNIDIFNSDGSIKYTKEKILAEFKAVMKKDISSFSPKKEIRHSSFRIDPLFCQINGISKKKVLGRVNSMIRETRKEDRYKEIDRVLSPEMIMKNTYKNCLEILSGKGINISLRTLKNYLKDRGIKKINK